MIVNDLRRLDVFLNAITDRIDDLPLLFDIPENSNIEISARPHKIDHYIVVSGTVRGKRYDSSASIEEFDLGIKSYEKCYRYILKAITQIASR